MKNNICQSFSSLLFIVTLTTSSVTFSQSIEATATSTTSEGTVSEFGPQGIIIKTAAGTRPVRYISNETTNFVDENGNPIAATLVTSGLPVTVFYTKVGDTLIASKIMVKTGAAAPVRTLETTQVVTMSAGTIREFGPEQIILQTESSSTPLPYTYSKTTTYVDESGAPVSIQTVKSGLPVTVYYTKVGNVLVASKVIVRKAPLIEEKKTTTTTTIINK
jgi:hypothetical protein